MTLMCGAVRKLLPLRDLCPVFGDDALPMLGDRLPGHPVAHVIRNDALRFDPPDWAAGHAASSRLARLVSDAPTAVTALPTYLNSSTVNADRLPLPIGTIK